MPIVVLKCASTVWILIICLLQPFYGGKKHKISAEVFSPGEKKPFLTVEGEWNGIMTAKWTDPPVRSYLSLLLISLHELPYN